MPFKLGAVDVSSMRLGTTALTKLMLGTVEVWSSFSADFLDPFTQADGPINATLYRTPTGPLTLSPARVVGNAAVPPAANGTDCGMILTSGVYGSRQWAMARCKLGVDYSEVCVWTQAQDTQDAFFGVWTTDGTHAAYPTFGTINGPAFQLYRMINGQFYPVGAPTVLGEAIAPASDGSFHRLKLVSNDRSLTLWFDGVRVIGPYDDSANTDIPLTGRPGFSMHRQVTGADPAITEFSGGGFQNAIPTPTLTLLSPSLGAPAGGDVVTVTGTGFIADATMVTIEGVKIALNVTSSTTGTFTTLPSTGVASVTVSTPGGTTAPLIFYYEAPPPVVGAAAEHFIDQVIHQSITVAKPSGLTGVANQGLLVQCLCATLVSGGSADPNIQAPAGLGFTKIASVYSNLLVGPGVHLWLAQFWSEQNLSAQTNFTFTFTNGFISRLAAIVVDGTSGPGVPVWTNISGVGPVNIPSVTTTEANNTVLSIGIIDNTGTFPTPSGFTAVTSSPNLTYLSEWWRTQATAGASPSPSITVSGSTSITLLSTTAMRPLIPGAAPDAPTGLSALGKSLRVDLSWTAPFDGGEVITDYLIQYRTTAGPGAWQSYTDAISPATTASVLALTDGTSYDFRVMARNDVGDSGWSATATATPTTPIATLVWSDTFTGANGTAWNSTYWGTAPGTSSIQNNKGEIINPSGAFNASYVGGQSANTPANYELQFELFFANDFVDGYFIFNFHEGFGPEIEWPINSTSIYFYGGGGSGTAPTFVKNVDTMMLSFRAQGNIHSATIWKKGTTKPSTPTLSSSIYAARTGARFVWQCKTGPSGTSFHWSVDNAEMYQVE